MNKVQIKVEDCPYREKIKETWGLNEKDGKWRLFRKMPVNHSPRELSEYGNFIIKDKNDLFDVYRYKKPRDYRTAYFKFKEKEYYICNIPKQLISYNNLKHFYGKGKNCISETDSKTCNYIVVFNKLCKAIQMNIKNKNIHDSDLIPYYNLHEYIKQCNPKDYDDLIKFVALCCCKIKSKDEEKLRLCNKFIKRIKQRIAKAVTIMCMMRNDCVYNELIKILDGDNINEHENNIV